MKKCSAPPQVSLGSLGVITAVRLRLLPLYRLHEQVRREPLDACLASLDERSRDNRHFEFFWYPADDCAFTKTLNPTDRPPTPPADEDGGAADAAGLSSAERERVDDSWRIFPTVRENRFNEMEYSVPAERGVECFLEVRELMHRKHTHVTWPIEYRTQAADDIFISPAQGRATVAISIHQGAELPHAGVLRRRRSESSAATAAARTGARCTASPAASCAELYPEWERFQARRDRQLDPRGRFLNEHLRPAVRRLRAAVAAAAGRLVFFCFSRGDCQAHSLSLILEAARLPPRRLCAAASQRGCRLSRSLRPPRQVSTDRR